MEHVALLQNKRLTTLRNILSQNFIYCHLSSEKRSEENQNIKVKIKIKKISQTNNIFQIHFGND